MAQITITYPNKFTTRLELSSVPSGTTRSQWKFQSNNYPNNIITTPSNAADITDSSTSVIELHLIKFHTYTVSVRHLIDGSYSSWTSYGSFENRGITNSYEHYLALTGQLNVGTTLSPT